MEEQAGQIERAVAQFKSEHPGAAYPREIRERVVKYVRRGRAQGRTWGELARAVGLGAATVHEWVAGNGKGERRAVLVPVAVKAEPDRARQGKSTVVVVSPSGFRLEGLSVREAADLLRMLS